MMLPYHCSVRFFICDINLEGIEKFPANNCAFPHWKKSVPFAHGISGNSHRAFCSDGKRPFETRINGEMVKNVPTVRTKTYQSEREASSETQGQLVGAEKV